MDKPYEKKESAMPGASPKGFLSTVGLDSEMGEQMAPEEGGHTDVESTHAETVMQAFKAGDAEAFRDSLKALIMECVRNYNSSE